MKRKMSRFVLRSNAEQQTKLTEQKEKSKSLTNPLKTPTKKADNRKGVKNCAAPKGPNQLTTSSPTVATVKCHRSTNSSSTTKERNELDEETQQQQQTQPQQQQRDGRISIICSLPLSRLSGIIEKLSIKTTPQKHINNDAQTTSNKLFTKPPNQTLSIVTGLEQSGSGNGSGGGGGGVDDYDCCDEKQSMFDDDTSNSKSQDQEVLIKTLCLYCEKQFNTQKMQQKHIEKYHSPQKDRRCSIRNSQVVASPRSKSASRKSAEATRMAQNYPGCTYCKKLKLQESTDPVRDFNGLFLHLTEQHADKYFGCKICIMRFQNIGNLIKHMQIVHNTLPEAQLKLSKDYELSDETRIESASPTPTADKSKQPQQTNQQRHSLREHESSASSSLLDQSDVIGAEDTILTRLGLTQNRRRMPSNRKGVRLRRDTAVPDIVLKSEGLMSSAATTALLAASPSKSRNKGVTTKSSNTAPAGSSDPDAVVFRVPVRTIDALSTTFDENFYKEVTANVRNNLLFHLDGKLEETRNSHNTTGEGSEFLSSISQQTTKSLPLLLRSSTLAPPTAVTAQECLESKLQETEIHVATDLPATTPFPSLLTAEQYCGDVRKIRRPHTKHSWKWKWDSVKKYKLINEGGKMVKKAKHPLLGLRDLSKLDMWTQLSMRQKYEKQLIALQNASNFDDFPSGEKRRLNDQLNAILDTRVLPHIILEQSEQAIIKLENETTSRRQHSIDGRDEDNDFYGDSSIVGQTFADEGFLSLLQLLPRSEARNLDKKLVLSGEWARPRCYMCMCCGNRFEKLKSLEEHKTFRHSNIFSTHYEVVGRELLAGNLLQYLFIPKRALSYYSAPPTAALVPSAAQMAGSAKKLMKYRRINVAPEEESSDSVQSVSNSYAHAKRAFNLKNVASTTDDCDDTDTTKTTLLGDMNTVSPSHSLQSSCSSSLTANSNQGQQINKQTTDNKESNIARNWNCSKCSRKCNGMPDLYRHMLDCSGDYIWSMAKKRKYRYYCGSKKRRQLHRQHSSESRKNKPEKTSKTQAIENCTTEESSSNSYKPKTPPRPRPSDAESIKKMLENLPPKRVCKTIFPAVNKAKKTKKPKFITKLYNTKVLRKTRARQLSQAIKRSANARLAAKAKAKASQNKTLNAIKCRTRKNICPTKQSSSNNAAATSDTPTTTDVDSKAEENEATTTMPMQKQINAKKEETSGSSVQLGEKCFEVASEKNSNNGKTEIYKSTDKTNTTPQETAEKETNKRNLTKTGSSSTSTSTEETTRTEMQSEEKSSVENEQQKYAKAITPSSLDTTPQQSVDTSACNRKRSKRISDCIAMLTGKLEEKLKTESSTTSTTIANTRSDESLESTEAKIAVETEKKAPKRKTISRRIIKTDVIEVVDKPVAVSIIETKTTTVATTVATTTTVATSLVVSTAMAVSVKTTKAAAKAAIAASTSFSTLKSTTKTVSSNIKTTPTAIATPTKEPLPMPATPNAPAKIMLPPPVTPPTLVSIPMPIATALHAVPVPLKVLQNHLPLYLPPQNLNTTPLALAAPVLQTPLPLTLTTNPSAPNAAAALLPAPITLLPPPPLLQAHISPVSTTTTTTATTSASPLTCSMEPLNLTSTKGAKKQTTAELRAQRPGLPARRQTICGFEARDLLTYNDMMEPLDLSIKSRASTTVETTTTTRIIATTKPTYTGFDFKTAAAQLTPLPLAASTSTLPPLPPPPMSSAEELTIKPSPSNSIVQTPLAPPTLPLPAIATATETIFNKQFYSNLELLKIPQIRAASYLQSIETLNTITNGMMSTATTAAAAQTQSALTLAATTVTTTTFSNANNEMLPQVQAHLLPSAQVQSQQQPQPQINQTPQLQKVNNKKRGGTKSTNIDISSNTTTSTLTQPTPAKVKETITPSKKETNNKQKPILKMDEEVINHIDDAINSVINAVKASLYETEQQQQQKQQQLEFVAKLDLPQMPSSSITLEAAKSITTPQIDSQKTEPTVASALLAPLMLSTPAETTATLEQKTAEVTVEPIITTITTTTTVVPPIMLTTIATVEPITSVTNSTNLELGKTPTTTSIPVTSTTTTEITAAPTTTNPTTKKPTTTNPTATKPTTTKPTTTNPTTTKPTTTKPTTTKPTTTKPTTTNPTTTKPTTAETIQTVTVLKPSPSSSLTLTPKKRNLRSKTLDCRSQLKEAVLHTAAIPNRHEIICSPLPHLSAAKQSKQEENVVNNKLKAKAFELKETKVTKAETAKETETKNETLEPTTNKIEPIVEKSKHTIKATTIESNKTQSNDIEDENEVTETPFNETMPKETPNTEVIATIAAETAEASTAALQESSNVNLITPEDNISNMINNTSSGFHSSSTPDNAAGDVKKKQRRRRKNELAAIVADQLLESFKIDKARRDSLKKLENLAYEKSDDLFVTGMLLMSSTKRAASTAICFNQNTTEKRSNENLQKRQKQQNDASSVINTRPKSRIGKMISEQNSATDVEPPSIPPQKSSSVLIETQDTKKPAHKVVQNNDDDVNEIIPPRRGRRGRPPRRTRGGGGVGSVKTPLDNENLSKLKSSLESFSIGIEKQLSEFEARNTTTTNSTKAQNLFKNSESKTTRKSAKAAIVETEISSITTPKAPATSSYILRPSILTATLEQAQAATKEETTKCEIKDSTDKKTEKKKDIKTSTTTTATGAIAPSAASTSANASNFSRDPRLNKNIHKDENPSHENATNNTAAAAVNQICDIEDDNYLTEIAKNVNEKIMAAENEDFAFADDDGFEIGTEFNDDDDDDSNSKYSRPPTSMSVRSAPNFNDDHSNFDSMCDEENTNTEAMDMDLDDELSVYTSFSQDLGRGRGRKRRRRRSILLKRRPKKPRHSSQDLPAEKFECELCKKTFFAATSLAKHNMTLAHVSKVSEREYLMSKPGGKAALLNDHFANIFPKKRSNSNAASAASATTRRRKRAQSMNLEIYERPSFFVDDDDEDDDDINKIQPIKVAEPPQPQSQPTLKSKIRKASSPPPPPTSTTTAQPYKPPTTPTLPETQATPQISAQRLSMNSDERLFYECCNILKSADTTRTARNEQDNENQSSFLYPKAFGAPATTTTAEAPAPINIVAAALNKINAQSNHENHLNLLPVAKTFEHKLQNNAHAIDHAATTNTTTTTTTRRQETLKNPVLRPSSLQKVIQQPAAAISTFERHAHSSTYSQFSAVTNTTQSRFKTKAAMKGYENGNVDITLQTQEMRSRPTCKLTELADIALGHDDKPQDQTAVAAKLDQQLTVVNTKRVVTPEYITLSVVDGRKVDGGGGDGGGGAFNVAIQENKKKSTTAETQGSTTSSKTIMHSSIIKAAVEEHGKAQGTNKIVIPERPFKNIGLEEKETITFQKPKTTSVNLLMDTANDDISVSTASYSDRDDFDFNSLSCDDDASIKNSNEKNLKSNTSDSSSSRATAKTFENKSLIMGRIFKNASTKAKTAAPATVVKSVVGVQKDHTPKADLNQLFDELRGDARAVKVTSADMLPIAAKDVVTVVMAQAQTKDTFMSNLKQPTTVINENASTTKIMQETKRKSTAATRAAAAAPPPPPLPPTPPKKTTTNKPNKKPKKDLSKLQTELGMSQAEVEKLIDEGQRKSKRRCAANRSKKLVETWSSDEYEEFLSTKDIIAMIEENEKKEQRRKRKSSISGETKEKSLQPTTATATTTASIITAESSTRKSCAITTTMTTTTTPAENIKFEVKNIKNSTATTTTGKTSKEKENERRQSMASTRDRESTTTSGTVFAKEKPASVKPTNDEATSTSKPTKSRRGRPPKSTKNTKQQPTTTINYGGVHKLDTTEKDEEEDEKQLIKSKKSSIAAAANKVAPIDSESAAASETDDNLYLHELKRNINNNINSNNTINKRSRTKKDKSAVKESSTTTSSTSLSASVKEAKEDNVTVNSCKQQKSREKEKAKNKVTDNTKDVIEMKKRNASSSGGGGVNANVNVNVSSGSNSNKKNKGKRSKPQAEKSTPVRKRKAAEKLYYWSSSSDEDFGRINENEHEPEFENTEQYQKHGWIVGDSHKKLVTLLAIAKGNKKQVDSCGVKKNVSKRKN